MFGLFVSTLLPGIYVAASEIRSYWRYHIGDGIYHTAFGTNFDKVNKYLQYIPLESSNNL
ncbi:MAG: hypothetical protein APF77_05850 [Clostridia bacterium BRH_c25]|nr:MAG: hypothetical protein APF77_05850 [Clostridia bacterium BRH_c25]